MLTLAFVLFSIVVSARATNDWNTPCTSGSCGYEWDADGVKTPFSSIMLTGPNQVLSDITPAAGWHVMGCNPNWSSGSHEIRMVCSGTPEQTQHCQHLFDNGGAEHTVVRLPQNCGVGPFAHVQKTYVPKDQSMPAHISKNAHHVMNPSTGGKHGKQDDKHDSHANSGYKHDNYDKPGKKSNNHDNHGNHGKNATGTSKPLAMMVHGLTLDYNFDQIPTSRGKLVMGMSSSNVYTKPITRRELITLRNRRRGRAVLPIDHFEVPEDEADGVFDGAETAVEDGGAVVLHRIRAAGTDQVVDKSNTSTLIPIDVSGTFNLLDANVKCALGQASGSASVHMDVSSKVTAEVKFGYKFVGSIVPLNIEQISVFSTINGDASATFNLATQAQGTFDTQSVPFFQAGLPGLSVPGIITLGPQFTLNGQLQMQLSAQAKMSVTAGFKFPDIEFKFPVTDGRSTAQAIADPGINPVQLSAQAGANVKGTVTTHIIPRVDFGIIVGNGLAKASVFVNMDIAGVLVMGINAGGSKTVGVGTAAPAKSAAVEASATFAKATATGGAAGALSDILSKAKAAAATAVKAPPAKATPVKAPSIIASLEKAASVKSPIKVPLKKVRRKRAAAGGCVTLTGKIAITGGLDGTIQPVFTQSTTFPIFSTQTALFNRCFGSGTAAKKPRRAVSGGSTIARMYRSLPQDPPAITARGLKNQITPSKSTASTGQLTCGASVVPLGSLSNIL